VFSVRNSEGHRFFPDGIGSGHCHPFALARGWNAGCRRLHAWQRRRPRSADATSRTEQYSANARIPLTTIQSTKLTETPSGSVGGIPTAINQRRRDEEETEMPSRPPTATGLETGHGRTCTGPADQTSRHTFSRLSRPQVVRQDVKKVSSAGRHGGRGESPHGGTDSAPSAREETTLAASEGDGEAHDEAEQQQRPGAHDLNRGARPERLTEPRPTMTLQAQMDMGGIERFRRSGPLFGDPVARFALSETG
jgi:hypothetical protein